MISTLPPRKDCGKVASPKRFGWGLAALSVVCLVLIVWVVFYDAAISMEELRARRAKGTPAETSPPESAENLPEMEGEQSAELQPANGTLPTLPDAAVKAAAANVASSQKAVLVSKRVDLLTSRAFSIVNIEPTFVKSPIYVLTNGKIKSFTPRTWLRVVVTFRSSRERIAGLSFRYKISIADEVFTGTRYCGEIFGDGDHLVAVFVVPAAVESAIRGRDLGAENLVGIEVVAVDGKDVLARSQVGKVTAVPQTERADLLRSVETTPFAPLEIDLYEKTTD